MQHLFNLPVKSVIQLLANTRKNNSNVAKMNNYHIENKWHQKKLTAFPP